MSYPDLHAHSMFSVFDGFGTPKQVVDRAVELGWGAACLTEHGWMGSAPSFYKLCREAGIKPILGCELYVVPDEAQGQRSKEFRQSSFHLTALALSKEGYFNLVAWNTFSHQPENFYYRPRISLQSMADVAPYPLHHNVILSGCLGGELCMHLKEGGSLEAAEIYLLALRSVFPNVYVEIQNHAIPKFIGCGFDAYDQLVVSEQSLRPNLIELAKRTNTPLVLTNDSHFQSPKQRKSHIAMRASAWRHRDDAHYGLSGEQLAAGYMKDYAYFGCVEPSMRVLTNDLKWKFAGELQINDKLWGFDEELIEGEGRNRSRRFRESYVENVDRAFMECYEVTFDDGSVFTVSDNHPWLVRLYPSQTKVQWVETRNLVKGNVIPQYLNVWNSNRSWGAGWLAGLLDGEGYVDGFSLKLAQKPGRVLSKTEKCLDSLGFSYAIRHQEHCSTIDIKGGWADHMELLGTVRPVRLLPKLISNIAGRPIKQTSLRTIVSCISCGLKEVVTLQTSSRTYFAEGFGMHNSYLRDLEKALDGIPDQALESIREIVEEADIKLDPLDGFNYSIPFSGRDDPIKAIRKRCRVRLEEIVRTHGDSARERFEFELRSMGEFAHYLLLLSDFIIHAKNSGILTNTRGSAANSILCYCLKIHDIDSIEYGLTFSRFFNPARKKLPDIDVDIEKDRFDDFMQYVHEKMEMLEGEGQVVQICNYGTQANRSAFRAAASALGMPKEEQDEISKLLPQMIDSGMVDEEADAYEVLKESYPDIYEIASTIFDQVKSVGQHACGWLFGTEGRTIEEWIPMYLIASSGKLVTQYDLKSLDEFGLVKGDFLRLRSLSVIKRTMEMVGMNAFDLDEIPLDDEATFEMLREGKTEGVFTLQGKENRRGCMEVEVEDIHGIINTVAIYRPALTREGKNTTYNKRRRGEEEVEYPHEIVEKVVGSTYGVPIFQEQAMELAYAVGCSDAEVDDLYQAIKVAKGIGRGAKEAFAKIEPKFMKRALKIMDEDEAEGVWEYVKSFQGYGFNKGHATSYGLLGYRSAYLKCHHMAQFFTSLLDTYPEKSKYIAAARSEGFKFLLPDVNLSGSGFTLDKQTEKIRVGLSRVKGLGPVAVREIIAGQPYSDLEDFKSRTSSRAVNKSRIEVLANVGALQSIGIPGDADDQTQFEILGFCVKKPKAMVDIKPKHVRRRVSDSGWEHLGREKGVEITVGRASVSKLFWIPGQARLELKASPWAQVKTWLLEAVDENGVKFQLMANEDRDFEVKALKFLSRRCQGAVVCVDGSIRQPFLTDGPQGFRFWGVTGAGIGDAQMWGTKKKNKQAISELARMKRRNA